MTRIIIGIWAITNNKVWIDCFTALLSSYDYLSLDRVMNAVKQILAPLPYDVPPVLLTDLDFLISHGINYEYVRALLVPVKTKYLFINDIGDGYGHDDIIHSPKRDRYAIDYYNKIESIGKSVQITFGVIRFMKGLLEKLFTDIEILSQPRWLRLFSVAVYLKLCYNTHKT